jgi:hypothetical protein
MRSPREQAREFTQRATECDTRAELEKDQGLKTIMFALAEYYRRLAKQRDPYQTERIGP